METIGITKFVKTQVNERIFNILEDIRVLSETVLNKQDIFKRFKKSEGYHKFVEQGFYPFSKIVRIGCHDMKSPIIKITDKNKRYLVSEYSARRKGEIPFLKRYFPKNCPIIGEEGHHLDVILYNKEQLKKEGTPIKEDWGIVCINIELKNSTPVTPTTMVNNHLGVEFGGNGSKLNKKEYLKSVKFWNEHAIKES